MKPLTKKILMSGLVNKHVAIMLERWGQLEEGASDLVGKERITKKTLEEFVEDIEEMVEGDDGEIKETVFAIHVKPPSLYWSRRVGSFSAAEDRMGRLIVSPSHAPHPGESVFRDSEVYARKVLSVSPIFIGETLFAYQVTLEDTK